MTRFIVLILVAAGLVIAASSCAGEKPGSNKVKTSKDAAQAAASFKKGDFKSAISAYESAAKTNPDDAGIQRSLGQSYEAVGRLDDAAKSYKTSLSVNPKQPETVYSLGIVYKSQGKNKEAIEQLEKAVSLNKEFIGARLVLGDLYAAQGSKNKAAAQYRAIIKLKPFGVDLKSVKKKLKKVS